MPASPAADAPKPRAPQHVIDKLREARRVANMERASFGFTFDTVTIEGGFDAGTKMTVDAFVKEKTRLYRESWLLPPLDDLIAWAEGRS